VLRARMALSAAEFQSVTTSAAANRVLGQRTTRKQQRKRRYLIGDSVSECSFNAPFRDWAGKGGRSRHKRYMTAAAPRSDRPPVAQRDTP
jgi:hypothetical protein